MHQGTVQPNGLIWFFYDVLSGYITTLKNKQKLDISSEGPSSRVKAIFHCSRFARAGGANITQLSL
jgi:hypothetical protein